MENWKEPLYISALIFFNVFCITGTIISVYIAYVFAKFYISFAKGMDSLGQRLQAVEESLTDWSWLGAALSITFVVIVMQTKYKRKSQV
jgi:hypothetical protein